MKQQWVVLKLDTENSPTYPEFEDVVGPFPTEKEAAAFANFKQRLESHGNFGPEYRVWPLQPV